MEEHIPLAPFTTFHLGGPARYFTRVKTLASLKESLDFAWAKHMRTQMLGGGSNVLFADEGFDGVVIKIEFGGLAFEGDTLVAGAGESWDALVAETIEKSLWGVENLSGIPGTVGGAVAGT